MSKQGWLGIAFIGLCMYSCSGSNSTSTTPIPEYYQEMASTDDSGQVIMPPQFDEDRVRQDSRADVMAEDYYQIGATGGEGHEAGFEWAKQNELQDRSECSGDSDSFIEGCRQFFDAIDDEVQTRHDDFDGEFNNQ